MSEQTSNPTSEAFGNDEDRPALLIGAAAVVAGLCLAAWVSWTCDDAFISFRYARNLVEGHGLVFNVGERVEGYTNLLWTLWIALGLALNVGAETWSAIFGLLSYGTALLLLFLFHAELRRALPVRRATLPVACLVAAAHPDWRLFATSGLETSTFTTVVLAGYLLLARGLVVHRPRSFSCGAIFAIAALLRPDGLVFGTVAFAAVALTSSRPVRDAGAFAATVGTVWAAATAFRLAYYGQYFPNTYYAKSAYLAWYGQGLIYLGTYFHKYWILLFGAAVVLPLARRSAALPSVTARRWYATHAVLAGAFGAAYMWYVVRVGGDFMYARLLVPATPFMAILFELSLHELSVVRPVVHLEAVAASLMLLTLIPRPVTGTAWNSGIADESAVYDEAAVLGAARNSEALANLFHGLPVRVAFMGTEARVMYQADIPTAIEADTGLTDAVIARQPLSTRGRVGHEKRASPRYLISTRSAQFLVATALDDLAIDQYIPMRTIKFGRMTVWILSWDPDLMAILRRRGASFDDFGEFLDRYIATISSRSPDELRADYEKFRHFYFEHVPDAARETPFRDRLHTGATL